MSNSKPIQPHQRIVSTTHFRHARKCQQNVIYNQEDDFDRDCGLFTNDVVIDQLDKNTNLRRYLFSNDEYNQVVVPQAQQSLLQGKKNKRSDNSNDNHKLPVKRAKVNHDLTKGENTSQAKRDTYDMIIGAFKTNINDDGRGKNCLLIDGPNCIQSQYTRKRLPNLNITVPAKYTYAASMKTKIAKSLPIEVVNLSYKDALNLKQWDKIVIDRCETWLGKKANRKTTKTSISQDFNTTLSSGQLKYPCAISVTCSTGRQGLKFQQTKEAIESTIAHHRYMIHNVNCWKYPGTNGQPMMCYVGVLTV